MSKAFKIMGIGALVVGAVGVAVAVTKVVIDKVTNKSEDSTTSDSTDVKTDFPDNVVNDSKAELMSSELKDDDKAADKKPEVDSDSLPKPKQAV